MVVAMVVDELGVDDALDDQLGLFVDFEDLLGGVDQLDRGALR